MHRIFFLTLVLTGLVISGFSSEKGDAYIYDVTNKCNCVGGVRHSLTINFKDIPDLNGSIEISFYGVDSQTNQAKFDRKKREKAKEDAFLTIRISKSKIRIQGGSTTIVVKGLCEGVMGMAALNDDDDNGSPDFRNLGIDKAPSDAYSFSGGKIFRWRSPYWMEFYFELKKDVTTEAKFVFSGL